jgi:hypothetical protein
MLSILGFVSLFLLAVRGPVRELSRGVLIKLGHMVIQMLLMASVPGRGHLFYLGTRERYWMSLAILTLRTASFSIRFPHWVEPAETVLGQDKANRGIGRWVHVSGIQFRQRTDTDVGHRGVVCDCRRLALGVSAFSAVILPFAPKSEFGVRVFWRSSAHTDRHLGVSISWEHLCGRDGVRYA